MGIVEMLFDLARKIMEDLAREAIKDSIKDGTLMSDLERFMNEIKCVLSKLFKWFIINLFKKKCFLMQII